MTPLRYYTGIGSRETPADVLDLMVRVAERLHQQGWRSRSGGAGGADQAFSRGDPDCEIYLPWKGFFPKGILLTDPVLLAKAAEIVSDVRVYPGYRGIQKQIEELETSGKTHTRYGKSLNSLKAVLKLQTRNAFQVLGADLKTLSEFCLCWTRDGAISRSDYRPGVTGGTGTAINLASLYSVPVANLQRPAHRKVFEDFLSTGTLDLSALRPEPQSLELAF